MIKLAWLRAPLVLTPDGLATESLGLPLFFRDWSQRQVPTANADRLDAPRIETLVTPSLIRESGALLKGRIAARRLAAIDRNFRLVVFEVYKAGDLVADELVGVFNRYCLDLAKRCNIEVRGPNDEYEIETLTAPDWYDDGAVAIAQEPFAPTVDDCRSETTAAMGGTYPAFVLFIAANVEIRDPAQTG